jgi:hypothetical protein
MAKIRIMKIQWVSSNKILQANLTKVFLMLHGQKRRQWQRNSMLIMDADSELVYLVSEWFKHCRRIFSEDMHKQHWNLVEEIWWNWYGSSLRCETSSCCNLVAKFAMFDCESRKRFREIYISTLVFIDFSISVYNLTFDSTVQECDIKRSQLWTDQSKRIKKVNYHQQIFIQNVFISNNQICKLKEIP